MTGYSNMLQKIDKREDEGKRLWEESREISKSIEKQFWYKDIHKLYIIWFLKLEIEKI